MYMNYLLYWNILHMLNYRIVNYNITEIAALEAVLTGIKVYLCDFHRQQSYSK